MIGERVWYQKPLSKGKDKPETRWEHGIFAGVRMESGELFMLIEVGAIKMREDSREGQKRDGATKRKPQ